MAREVTVRNTETGEVETAVVSDDYLLITDGKVYIANLIVHRTGTHQITVKGVPTGGAS